MSTVTEINEVKLNGIDYVRKDSISKTEHSGEIKIVILQRGWVMVGQLKKNGTECKLYNSSNIRIWGTTKGLGEIADGGPTSSTKLDKNNGIVEFDSLTIVATISCNSEKWKGHV